MLEFLESTQSDGEKRVWENSDWQGGAPILVCEVGDSVKNVIELAKEPLMDLLVAWQRVEITQLSQDRKEK